MKESSWKPFSIVYRLFGLYQEDCIQAGTHISDIYQINIRKLFFVPLLSTVLNVFSITVKNIAITKHIPKIYYIIKQDLQIKK